MSDIAIRVENLSKKYVIGHERARAGGMLRDRIANGMKRLLSRNGNNPASEEFWALKDVSFDVKRGEVVGIIGRNGAGKSTLLKILSRITDPTSGHVELRGRIASLLEVGTGFHQELTGRENVYLSGAILGMSHAELDSRFEQIVAFAETDQFVDTPVKYYSSGMQMRLAFSVAAHLEPEILLVDEVLAVGDSQFQKKCLGKLNQVAIGGRTVLFVSHNLLAVERLCNSCLWLDKGHLIDAGPSTLILSKYSKRMISGINEVKWPDATEAPGNQYVRIKRAAVCNALDPKTDRITMDCPARFEFEIWNLNSDVLINLSLHVYHSSGILVFNTASINETQWHGKQFPKGLFRSTCLIPANFLNEGFYHVELLVVRNENEVIYKHNDLIVFEVGEVSERGSNWFGHWPGVVHPNLDWTTTFLSSDTDQQEAGEQVWDSQ